MPDFNVESSEIGTATVLKVTGQIRLDATPLDIALRKVIAKRPPLLVFDLSGLSFVSTLGMGCLVNAHRSLKAHSGKIRLAGTQPAILDGLTRARLIDLFPNFATVQDALATT